MEPEEKFKISLINLEKKILDLESVVGELSEQIKKIDLDKIRSRIEEFEDLTMVSNLALLDLKKKVEEKRLTDEELKRIVDEIKPDVTARLVEFKEEFAQKIPELGKGFADLKKEMSQLRTDFKVLDQRIKELKESPLLGELDSKVTRLETGLKEVQREHEDFERSVLKLSSDFRNFRKKISQLEERDIKKILSEISLSRSEFSREIREIREQLESLAEKTSGVDLTLLSSKFNSLKESVDYLLNRKVETDMKLKTIEESLSKVISSGEVVPQNILKSMEKLSEKLKTLEGGLNYLKTTVIDEIGEKVGELERRLRMIEVSSPGAPTSIVEESIKLFAKVKDIENRLKILEAIPTKPTGEIELGGIMRNIEEIEKNVRLDLVSLSNLLESRIAEVENKVKELEGKIKLQALIPKMDEKLADLLAKINNLEGRIAALEKSRVSAKTPIILE